MITDGIRNSRVFDWTDVRRVTDTEDTANPTIRLDHPLVVRLGTVLNIKPQQMAYLTPGEETRACGRCRGTGNLPQYRALNGGDCFDCEGSGVADQRAVYRVQYCADPAEAQAYRERQDRFSALTGEALFAALFTDERPPAPDLLTAEAH